MFCPSCGAESRIDLNYCNRCGANLGAALASPVEIAPISLTKPLIIVGLLLVLITMGGLAGVVSGTIEMIRAGGKEVSAAIPIFGMPTILVIDILLIRLLSKLVSAALQSNRAVPTKLTSTHATQLHSSRVAKAHLDPAASVTENTTRFFEQYNPASAAEPIPMKKRSDK
ncbi:MAG TPA: zinc ribbon domain-containing protein [Pyrinomonadaceae bacterium]|jgi:hypothetical protein|nr:zinc ribbon domain-containing protein [Pyrinomonadaceae bacterium]